MGLNIKFEILYYDFLRLYHFKQKTSNIVRNRYYVIVFFSEVLFCRHVVVLYYDNNNKLSCTAPRVSRIVPVIYRRISRSIPRERITVQTDSWALWRADLEDSGQLWMCWDTKILSSARKPNPVASLHTFRIPCKVLLICGSSPPELPESKSHVDSAQKTMFTDS
jgi:hypothetical protein